MAKIPIPFIGGSSAGRKTGPAADARVSPPFYPGWRAGEADLGPAAESQSADPDLDIPDADSDLETPAATAELIEAGAESEAMEMATSAPSASSASAAPSAPIEDEAALDADVVEETADQPTPSELEPPPAAAEPEPFETEPWAVTESEAVADDETELAEPAPWWDVPTDDDEESSAAVAEAERETETDESADEPPRYTPLEAAADIWGEDTGQAEEELAEAEIEAEAADAAPEAYIEERSGRPRWGGDERVGVAPHAEADEDEAEADVPDFLLGADGADMDLEPEESAGAPEAETEAAALASLASELLEGAHGSRIRELIAELAGEGTDRAVTRAFAAGYLAARERLEAEE